MPDNDSGLWITLWLVGSAICVALFVWARRFRDISGPHNRVRPFILLGVIPCGGLNVIFGLIAFAIFMARALPAERRENLGGVNGQQSGLTTRSLLPSGTSDRIVAYGRNSYYHDPNYQDHQFVAEMYHLQQVDRDRFLTELLELAQTGGWLALGCERLMIDVVGHDLPDPRNNQLMEAACDLEPFLPTGPSSI